MTSWWDQEVGHGSFIVFQRLNNFYQTFLVLAGLIAALSVGSLALPEFHPSDSPLAKAAEGLFVSSTAAAVICTMLGSMLLFRFEGLDRATRKDLLLACSPLVILDYSIVTFLAGLILWYSAKNPDYRRDLVGPSIGLGLLFSIWVAYDMFVVMKKPGGLGRDELKYIRKHEEAEKLEQERKEVRPVKPPFEGKSTAVSTDVDSRSTTF